MRDYMERLGARGDLLEVHREVHPKHELAAVTRASHKRWGVDELRPPRSP